MIFSEDSRVKSPCILHLVRLGDSYLSINNANWDDDTQLIGDVVVARITPCLENGKTALISLLKSCELGFGSTEFIVLRGKKTHLGAFAAQLSRSVSFRQFSISNMTGTSGRKRIDASTLETFSLPDGLLLKFEETTRACFERMTKNAQENQRLTQLRDWLLPMLMNGQVSVK